MNIVVSSNIFEALSLSFSKAGRYYQDVDTIKSDESLMNRSTLLILLFPFQTLASSSNRYEKFKEFPYGKMQLKSEMYKDGKVTNFETTSCYKKGQLDKLAEAQDCQQEILKDTADEAVAIVTCPEGKAAPHKSVVISRWVDKKVVITGYSEGLKTITTQTHLGPCDKDK